MSRQAIQSAPPAAESATARSQYLDASLDKAHRLATSLHHAGVSSEHLLFALTEDPEALVVLGASTVDIDRLRADITTHLGRLPSDTPASKAILPTADLLKVLKLAAMAAQQSARRQIDGAIVLAAVIGDASTPSAGLLRAHGLTFNEVIRVLQKAVTPHAAGVSSPPVQTIANVAPQPHSAEAEPTEAKSTPVPPMTTDGPPVPPRQSAPSDVAPPAQTAEPPTVATRSQRSSTDEILASVRARLQEAAPPPVRRADKPAFVTEPQPAHSQPDAPPPASAERTDPPTIVIAPPNAPAAVDKPAVAEGTNSAPPVAIQPAPAPVRAPDPAAAAPPLDGPRTPDDLLPQPTARIVDTAPIPPPRTPASAVVAPAKALANAPVEALDAIASTQPPLPLVPAATQRSGPPPLPLPTVSGPAASAPNRAPPPMPSPSAHRDQPRVPPIPPPAVDLRALIATLPRRLRQGQTDVIEVVVPRRSLEIPPAPGHRWPPLRVATMRLRAGDDAHVELASPETLWISPPRVHQGADDATWRWRVTPRNKGRIRLSLAGATRIVGSEGISGEIPLGEESIEIDIARRGSRRGLVGVLLFGNLLAIGFLAMLMSGRASELLLGAWQSIRALAGM